LASLKLDGIAPSIALTACWATSAAKEAVVSHMCFFNIPKRIWVTALALVAASNTDYR